MAEDKITDSFLNFRRALVRIVGGIVKDPIEVEDILQETYIRSFEANKKQHIISPKAFLARTARNLALNHIQRSAVKYNISTGENDALPVYSSNPGVEEQVEWDQRFRQFCAAVKNLPTQCRRVFVLKQVYGLSRKEIAQRLDLSEKTVEYHIGQGLFKCRKYLAALESSSKADVIEHPHNEKLAARHKE